MNDETTDRFRFDKEFVRDLERIRQKLPSIIKKAQEQHHDKDLVEKVSEELLNITFSSFINILSKYEEYQNDRLLEIEKKIDRQ